MPDVAVLLPALAFYFFAAVTVGSAVAVVVARNPVHAVLFLILAFFSAAGLFVLMGAEFLAMIVLVVYIGAVAVLFLFVVMMLDVDFADLRQGFRRSLPVGALVGLLLLAELALVFAGWRATPGAADWAAAPVPTETTVTNAEALGALLYTQYAYLFQVAGLILLVAMVGAIVLTLRARPGVRKQNAGDQIGRPLSQTIEVRKVPTGRGI